MARIRTIKPEFWSSPGIETLDFSWRLLYVAMWNWADDYGRGTAEARELMGFVFPRDENMTVGEFRRGLGEVRRVFGVEFYQVDGRPYYAIPSWNKHQKIDKRSRSRWPDPRDGEQLDPVTNTVVNPRNEESPRESAETPPSPRRDSGAGTGEQGNRGTGEQSPSLRSGEAPLAVDTEPERLPAVVESTAPAKADAPKAKRGTRIPDDWQPARTEANQDAEAALPTERLRAELAKFRDYWTAKTGQAATKLDWDATWRNWVRRAAETTPQRRPSGPRTAAMLTAEDWDRMAAEVAGGVL